MYYIVLDSKHRYIRITDDNFVKIPFYFPDGCNIIGYADSMTAADKLIKEEKKKQWWAGGSNA